MHVHACACMHMHARICIYMNMCAWYACILCMHAYACMHMVHACISRMHAYACMHTMRACILCMHAAPHVLPPLPCACMHIGLYADLLRRATVSFSGNRASTTNRHDRPVAITTILACTTIVIGTAKLHESLSASNHSNNTEVNAYFWKIIWNQSKSNKILEIEENP